MDKIEFETMLNEANNLLNDQNTSNIKLPNIIVEKSPINIYWKKDIPKY